MPDRDEFALATTKCRAAAEALLWSSAESQQMIKDAVASLWRAGRGIASLPYIMAAIGDPLLAIGDTDATLDNIDRAARRHGKNELDLIAARAAQRAVLRQHAQGDAVIAAVIGDIAEHFIVDARGGVVAQAMASRAGCSRAEHIVSIRKATEEFVPALQKRPGTRRLTLKNRRHIDEDTELT